MGEASYYAKGTGGSFVTETLEGCHPLHKSYPLLKGDWIVKRENGTYGKIGPGLGIEGFVLTEEQEATLQDNTEEITVGIGGMGYFLSDKK